MPDYSLGRAHGKIELDYDGRGAQQAARDIDKVAKSSDDADKSLSRTEKTLGETSKQLDANSTSAQSYSSRLREVRDTSQDADRAERAHSQGLQEHRGRLDEVSRSYRTLDTDIDRHTRTTHSSRQSHRELTDDMRLTSVEGRKLTGIIGGLNDGMGRMFDVQQDASSASRGLGQQMGGLLKVVGLFVPELRAVGLGVSDLSEGFDKAGVSADGLTGKMGLLWQWMADLGTGAAHLVQQIAGFEVAFGKISGLALGLPSLAGLAGLGGASALQGLVEVADAVRQLSGLMGLLPAAISGAAFSLGTLKIAFHGVGDALKDMMADDPKKFLEDIAKMGPAAAQSMLQVAQFRNLFMAAGGAIQDSFFSKITADIAPLIQTWLPAVTSGMSKVSGIFGDFAHEFAQILMQPQTMAAFTSFIENMSNGLRTLQPAMEPLMQVFTTLVTVGSRFFQQIGANITELAQQFAGFVNGAAASGRLQEWIQTGINAFGHLVHVIESVGSAFMTIMNVADKFGGGGLLGWLDKVTAEFDKWTQSAEGQKTLTDFFSTLRTATDAFLPMLKPLVEGLASIGQAFTQLGIGIAPGWQTVFNTFRDAMAQLGPQIVGMGPALNQFLTGMAKAFGDLMTQVGPQLPQIFKTLADAFVALLPQIGPLAQGFVQLVEQVGPQLPKLFGAMTDMLNALIPHLPEIIELTREFVSVITKLVEVIGGVIDGISKFNDALRDFSHYVGDGLSHIWDALGNFFNDLPNKAMDWGKNLIQGLIRGMLDSGGLGGLSGAASSIVDRIAQWFQHSPAKVGPFSGSGYTKVRGQMMVEDMAAGMMSAQGAITAAGSATASAAAGGMASGGGGARAPFASGLETAGGALLPDNIAGADVSILDRYLSHEFDDKRGLKGLAKDLGNILNGFQNGFNFLSQYGIQQVLQTLTAMPFGQQQTWRKIPPDVFAKQQAQELMRKAGQQGPSWTDVLGPAAGGGAGHLAPLDVNAKSSKEQIQAAIIAAGKGRGLDDAAIQTALAIAAAESGFNPTISGGVQGSAGLVSGLFQQSPSSGWGTLEQVNDPAYAINAFYNAFVQQLAKNPGNPLLAGVLTQNPQLGGGAQGSKYMQDVMAQLGLAKQILGQTPNWQQVTGGSGGVPTVGLPGAPAPAAGSIKPSGPLTKVAEANGWVDGNGVVFSDQAGRNPTGMQWRGPGKLSPLPAAGVPTPAGAPGASGIGLNPASQATRVPIAPNVEAGIRAIGGLPSTLYPTSGQGAYQVPAWAQQLAAAFGLTASTYANGGSLHQMGYAFDFNDPDAPNGPSAKKEAFAQFIMQNLRDQTLQLIYRGSQDYGIASGQVQGQGQYYTGSGGYQEHTDHVHWGTDVPVLMNGQVPPGSMVGNVTLPSGSPLSQLVDSNGKVLNVNQQQLQAYLNGNPALAAQIGAAQMPGAGDQQTLAALNGIDGAIKGLQAQDAVGNQNLIQSLQSTQQQIASNQGFQQGPNMIQTFSSFMGSASNAVSSVIQAVQGGLDAMAATQDIADRLVYGIRNTEDVMKIVDNVQKYITFASQVAMATGNVLSMIGGLVGAGGSGDASGASSGAAMALNSAGQIAQLISGVLQGVNAAIDFGQQIYHIAGTYVGRLMSQMVAGLGGTPLMGDVRFLLNKNTGQLLSYSQDNPGNQNALGIPSWINQAYGYGGGNQNPQVSQQLNVYAGPGQSTGQMMQEVVWMVNTGGTSGAMAPANF